MNVICVAKILTLKTNDLHYALDKMRNGIERISVKRCINFGMYTFHTVCTYSLRYVHILVTCACM